MRTSDDIDNEIFEQDIYPHVTERLAFDILSKIEDAIEDLVLEQVRFIVWESL